MTTPAAPPRQPLTLTDVHRQLVEMRDRLDRIEAAMMRSYGDETQPVPLLPGWLRIAYRDIGLAEEPGERSHARIAQAFALVGLPARDDSTTAWCAAILALWLVEGGCNLSCPVSTRTPRGKVTASARSWLLYGVPIVEPRVGAIAVFPRGNNTSLGHVGIVVSWTETTLAILSGNSGNRVRQTDEKRSECLGMRWPSSENLLG